MDKKIYDYAVGEAMALPVLIKGADVRMTKGKKPYIAFTFQDKSGQIDAKHWNASPEDIENFQVGRVVLLSGEREVYKDTPQIRIKSLRLVDHAHASDFVDRIGPKQEDLEEELNRCLFWITDAAMARISRHIFNKYKKDFYEFPAAKRHHHALAGGLAFHTLSMLRLADHLCQQYPEINRSLLVAGVLLHDIGKVVELSGTIGTDYTLTGKLLGHIVIMDEEITKACLELGIDEEKESVLLLKHLILAHHGQLEFGSPVRPIVMEAEVLHQLDLLDANLNMMISALDKTKPGEFTEKIYGLDNRMFYKPQQEKKGQ